jgi:uncharacterized membrane protein
MYEVAKVGFWVALFLITHLGMSSVEIRSRLIGALGGWLYESVYSLVSLATFIPLVVVFGHHKHAGPMLWNFRDVTLVRSLAWLIMFASLIMLVAGFSTLSTVAIKAQSEGRQHGIFKLTRHPAFVAVALFGLAHMIMNGWLGDLTFFGGFIILGVVGGWHQDQRKIRELGEPYHRLIEQTSFMPGAALLAGRQRWQADDMPWRAIAIGAAFTLLLVAFHPMFFGGYPLGG